jgi:hypothetical protein
MHSANSVNNQNLNFQNYNIHEWTTKQVGDWISRIGFSNYKKQFEQVNGMKLVNLTNEILKNVSLKMTLGKVLPSLRENLGL